jgi:hypothetical protein
VKDAWGIPVLRFSYKFGENEQKMAKDMAVAGREMFEAAKFEILSSSNEMLPEGLVHSRTWHCAHGHRS